VIIILASGAEATIELSEYIGIPAVYKQRVKKGYRHPELDRRIIVSRTRNEVRCMIAAREAGVHVPWVLDVDDDAGLIVMEFIEGETLNKLLPSLGADKRKELEKNLGREIAKLHSAHIAHGDLTTSNLVFRDGIYFLDFSMSSRPASLEQLGVDFRLLHEVYTSTHAEFEDEFKLIISGYLEAGGSEQVIDRMREIERRARYV